MKKIILYCIACLALAGCAWPGVDTKTKGYHTIPPPPATNAPPAT